MQPIWVDLIGLIERPSQSCEGLMATFALVCGGRGTIPDGWKRFKPSRDMPSQDMDGD